KAGIGRKFIKARAIESIPTNDQNRIQSTSEPNIVAIPTGPESALSARISPLNILEKPLKLSHITENALPAPIGNASASVYLLWINGILRSSLKWKPRVPSLLTTPDRLSC